MYMGQGCNYLQWAHGRRGSSCLQWVHGGGGPAAYRGYMRAGGSSGQGFQSSAYMKVVGSAAYNRHVGEGVQLLTVGTWRQGLQCAYMYMRVGAGGPATYSGYMKAVQLHTRTWGRGAATCTCTCTCTYSGYVGRGSS